MNICIFAASSDALDTVYFNAAFELGKLIADGGHCLLFGGGATGLMGACARGVIKNGGTVHGVAPRFFDEPGILLRDGCSLFLTATLAQRKTYMVEKADAFIALPGGIGTYEEFFETLTLKALGQHSKPMALLNTGGYYEPFQEMMKHSAENGFLGRSVFDLYALCETPEDALRAVCGSASSVPSPRGIDSYGK